MPGRSSGGKTPRNTTTATPIALPSNSGIHPGSHGNQIPAPATRPKGSARGGRISSAKPAGKLAVPNSATKKSVLEPYHDLVSTVFDLNDSSELEELFINAAKVSTNFLFPL